MKITKNFIKEIFINRELCGNNDYLDKYAALILEALTNIPDDSTQQHHIIPVFSYGKTNTTISLSRSDNIKLANKDQNNFLVRLTAQDHLKAHYYLALAAKQDWFKTGNLVAITNMQQFNKILLQDILDEDMPADIADWYRAVRCWVNKNGQYRRILERDLLKYLQSGWEVGAAKISKSTKNKKKTTATNVEHRIWIHNQDKQLKVFSAELLVYLKAGWCLGMSTPAEKRRKFVLVHTNDDEKRIPIDDLINYLSAGWEYGQNKNLTKAQRRKNRQAHAQINKEAYAKVVDKAKEIHKANPDMLWANCISEAEKETCWEDRFLKK